MFTKLKTILLIMVYMIAVIPASFAAAGINATNDGSLEETGIDGDLQNTTTTDEGTTDEGTTDDEEVEVVTEEEVNILSDGIGAQVRMLQLQKRVEAQSEAGVLIINRINEVKPEFNTTRLSEIVDEFDLLIGLIEEYDYNQPQETLVNDYVSMKKQAIDLTQEFKKIAKESLSDADKAMLREKAELKKQEKLQIRDERLEELKQKYELKELGKFATKMGYDVENARARLQNGEVTIEEIRQELISSYQNLDNKKKTEIQNELKEARIKSNIEIKERRSELTQKAEERRSELMQKAQERRAEIMQKAQERRIEMNEKAQERRIELNEKAEERRIEMNEKAEERRIELNEKAQERRINPEDFQDDSKDDESMSNESLEQ